MLANFHVPHPEVTMSSESTRKPSTRRPEPVEVSASEMKNGWHEYLERVSRSGEEIVITRYGKPVARLAPLEPDEERSIVGWLAGTVTINGDIIEPIDVEWEANA